MAPVAFVTGASRGIGKQCAVALAEAGYDVAITARTHHQGEAREWSPTLKESRQSPLPGSLDETAAIVVELGRRVLPVPADLLDLESLEHAVERTLEEFGRIDVLVNNARYVGPGHFDRLLDTPIELIERQLTANVTAPLRLCQLVLPQMVERGEGTIVDITSSSAYTDPLRPPGEGGWGAGYGVSKAGFHRIVGLLKADVGPLGVRCFNVQPGGIATERHRLASEGFGIGAQGAPPEVVAAVVGWLVTSPEASAFDGETIEAQHFCHERGLLPGWAGPQAPRVAYRFDPAAEQARRYHEALLSVGDSS